MSVILTGGGFDDAQRSEVYRLSSGAPDPGCAVPGSVSPLVAELGQPAQLGGVLNDGQVAAVDETVLLGGRLRRRLSRTQQVAAAQAVRVPAGPTLT